MSFKADTYKVVIASPSDLGEERVAATDAINDWNAQHAEDERVVLLPVKWETHATPVTGQRPQETINSQLIRGGDILIVMFWTKLGSPTGVAESGTAEEIKEFVTAGKPAMIYFSSRPINPSLIDIDQLNKLKAFKSDTYKNALVGNFASVDQLRSILQRDLLRQVRGMSRVRVQEAAADTIEVLKFEWLMKTNPECNGLFLTLLNNGRDVYDLKVHLEIDCGFPSNETAHLSREEQTLERGCVGLLGYDFKTEREGDSIPNPWKPGMALDLYLGYELTTHLPGFCGGRKFQDLFPDRVWVSIYGAGRKLLKRIPGKDMPEMLNMW